jgi:hypothetical protein
MTLQTTLENAVTQTAVDSDLFHQVVHGSDSETVTTEGGDLNTVAKLLKDADDRINSEASGILASTVAKASEANQSAQAAAISAAAAADSEAQSDDRATAAAMSADSAQISANSASQSAAQAAVSAQLAASAEVASDANAATASGQATVSSERASAAAASASLASTSASEAAQSAQQAAISAANAASSEGHAEVSAGLAQAERIAAELARDRAEGAADTTTTNTVIPTQNIVGDGSDAYTINRSVSYAGAILVECAGVTQTPLDAYNVVSGNQLIFSAPIPVGVMISVRWLDKESQAGSALALEWAAKDRNQAVSGSSLFSARHYALEAADSATAADQSEASAFSHKNDAAASAQAADQSEAQALFYKNEAQGFRNEAQAFAASAGGAANSTPITFTANGTQTDFGLTSAAQNRQSILVTVNTVLQDMFEAYELADAGAVLRFTAPPPSGARIVVRYL